MTAVQFRIEPMDAGQAAVVMQAMRDEIAEMYEGLDLDSPAMPAGGAAELGPPHGAFLVGYEAGRALCCGGLKRLDDQRCELKRMYVVPAARGRGVARSLLVALEDAARRLGYSVARLDTGPRQPAARHLYESAGYAAIANFNGNPIASFFGEKRLG